MTASFDIDGGALCDAVTAARQLLPGIAAARDEAQRLRQVPPSVADVLDKAGLYRMYLPRSLAGPELQPSTVFEVIEELSSADGSIGWCLMNANLFALTTGWLEPEAGRQIVGEPPNLRAAGSLRPQGRAWPVDGGYRIEGRWNFASGLQNANWLHCPCVMMDADGPQRDVAGGVVTRTMWVPAAAANVVDTWSVLGMRGTGSHDFILSDTLVPKAHSFSLADPPPALGPLYRVRFFFSFAHALFAANALGIARSAIDALIHMASVEASSLSTVLLRDRPAVQAQVAQAEAIVEGAKCYVKDALLRAWEAAESGAVQPTREIARVRLAIPHAIRESVRAVDIVFHAAGTNAIFTVNPLERPFRDVHVAAQHAAAFPVHFESAGKVLMGLQPSEPGW